MFYRTDFLIVKNWSAMLNRIPANLQDAFFRFDYHDAYASIERANPEAFVYVKDDAIIIMPYLKRKLSDHGFSGHFGNYYDVTSVYGYSGLIGVNYTPDQVEHFMQAFDDYCKSSKIVSSFFRLHPLLANNYMSKLKNVTRVNSVVYLPTKEDINVILSRCKHGVRKGVRKANVAGIVVRRTSGIPIDVFKKIYFDTMDRNKAQDFYYFDHNFFVQLSSAKNIQRTYVAYLNDEPVSIEIVLCSSKYWSSFLGGTKAEYLGSCANTLIKYQIISDAIEEGIDNFILGGGVSEGDGIYRYKKSFSPNYSVDFFIQTNIHDVDVYEALLVDLDKRFPQLIGKDKRLQRYILG